MIEQKYNIIAGVFSDTRDIPKGYDIFYKCSDCGGIIPSVPKDNVGCDCGNIFIDIDFWRLSIDNFEKIRILKKKKNKKN